MKPNNDHTSPEHRFFFPPQGEVEHHDSLDVHNLPGTVHIPGSNHHVLIQAENGNCYGVDLQADDYCIPPGAVVQGVAGFASGPTRRHTQRIVPLQQYSIFDAQASYESEGQDTYVIVQLDKSRATTSEEDSMFDENGIAILPAGSKMPVLSGDKPDNTRYRLLGFINDNDKLVTWHDPSSEVTSLIDLCVANTLKENNLEEALLKNALSGTSLPERLLTKPVTLAYLRYFGGDELIPKKDPLKTPDTLKKLTLKEQVLYDGLASLVRG